MPAPGAKAVDERSGLHAQLCRPVGAGVSSGGPSAALCGGGPCPSGDAPAPSPPDEDVGGPIPSLQVFLTGVTTLSALPLSW